MEGCTRQSCSVARLQLRMEYERYIQDLHINLRQTSTWTSSVGMCDESNEVRSKRGVVKTKCGQNKAEEPLVNSHGNEDWPAMV